MSVPGSIFWPAAIGLVDLDGNPLALGLVYFSVAGESTDKDTFTTAALDVANTNPITLDAYGRLTTCFLEAGGYDIEVHDADDVYLYGWLSVEDVGQTYFTQLGAILAEGSKDLSANYTVTNDDNTVTLDSGTAKTLTLQAAADRELPLSVLNLGTGAWAVTPNGAETINGATGPYSLTTLRAANLVPVTGGYLMTVADTA